MFKRVLLSLVITVLFVSVALRPAPALAQTPVPATAQGPSIHIGDPTCTGGGFSLFQLQYVYYDPQIQKCITIHYIPYSRTESEPITGSTNNDLLPGLLAFDFPTFLSLDQINNFSVWSYLSMIVTLIFTLMIIFWVLTLARAGLAVMHSSGDPSGMQGAQKKFSSIFAGVIFLIGFFLLLNIVASFLGIGNFSQWPKVFSQCRDGEYYFNKKLSGLYSQDSQIDNACFYGCGQGGC